MSQFIDGLQLPKYSDMSEIVDPEITKNLSISGKLLVDGLYTRRGWKYKYEIMEASTYSQLRAKYDKQFTLGTFLQFTDDELSVNAMCLLTLPKERDIIWNKAAVSNITIILEPQNADSL